LLTARGHITPDLQITGIDQT